MIKSLLIENFQSHERSELQFHPGLNVIIGLTDSGKSGIIRSIRWISKNKPSGNSIRSNWGGETHGELETENGKVTRIKDKEDIYLLHIQGQSPLTFKASGSNVPEEIIAFLHFDDLNTQFQLEGSFLLSKSSGEVAQHFNKVASLDLIDFGLQRVNSWIRNIVQVIGSEEKKDKPATGLFKQIAETQYQLSLFEDLSVLEAELEVIEEMTKQLEIKRNQITNLTVLVESYEQKDIELEEASILLELEKPVDDLLHLYDERETKLEELDRLNSLLIDLVDLESDLNTSNVLISLEKEVLTILQLYDQKESLNKDISELSELISDISDGEVLLKETEQKLNELEAYYKEVFPDICPLCEQPIKNNNYDSRNIIRSRKRNM